MDTVQEVGGQDSSLTPKEMILSGLGGCTGMDTISILKKMKNIPEKFEIEVKAETEEEFPKEFKSFKIIYKFWGKDLDKKKVEKAVNLSQDKYCGVSETLKKGAELNYEIIINDE
jgi:putative redox protein